MHELQTDGNKMFRLEGYRSILNNSIKNHSVPIVTVAYDLVTDRQTNK